MKTLYIDCGMGAAGDMLTAALLELMEDKEKAVEKLNSLHIPAVKYEAETTEKCGITGTHMHVYVNGEEEEEFHHHHEHGHHHDEEHDHDHEHHHDHDHDHDHERHHDHDHDHDHEHHHDHDHDHEHEHHHHDHDHEHEHHHDHEHEHHHDHEHGHGHHHHGSMHEIEHMISHMDLPENVKEDIKAVYQLIAEAESHVHNKPITDIHFHEVGTLDAVADVAAVCYLMNELHPDRIMASPVHVGAGTVRCAHGVLPVPAPATAHILQDVPIYGGRIQSELCTPTGAALLKHFVEKFADMPVMKPEKIGYGMGKKDFERANCVRAILGSDNAENDMIYELSCNLDDMTAEEIGFAMEMLYSAGAREVYTLSAGTKKNRPSTVLKVLVAEKEKDAVVNAIFKHTTTIGIREAEMKRYILKRETVTVDTPFGPVRKKISKGYGVETEKYEYDDLSRIAKEQNMSIRELKEKI